MSVNSTVPPRRQLKGFLGILGGSALAQILALAALPVLARLYTPSDTAHYALLLGASMVLASFAGLRLDLAVPLPNSDQESKQLFWLASLTPLVVLPATGVFVGTLLIVVGVEPDGLYLPDYIWICVFVLVLCVYNAASQLAIRFRAYRLLSSIPVLQMVGTLATQVALGAASIGRGLFVGGVLGRSLGIIRLFRASEVNSGHMPGRRRSAQLIREYWRFPAIFVPASLVETMGINATAFMLPALFGFGPAGLYAMAIRITAAPGAIVSQSAGQVFLGEFARAPNVSESKKVFLRWSTALLALGTLVAVAIWVLAPLLLPWVLGDDWTGVVELAQYSGIMTGAAIFSSPLHHVWTVRQRGLSQLTWNLVRLAATAGVIWGGADAGLPIQQVVAQLAIATCGVYLIAWLSCLRAASRPAAGANR